MSQISSKGQKTDTDSSDHLTPRLSIALVPDRFGIYRYSIFKRLSDYQQNGFTLTIYADTKEDVPGLKLVDKAYCDLDYTNGGIAWVRIRNFAIRRICFWQSGLIHLALSGRHQVHVYWGEAHRISTWLSVLLSKARGKRVVFWSHGLYGNERPLKKLIRTTFYRLADAVLLYGDYARQLMISNGFDERKLYTIKNSLDVDRQNSLYVSCQKRAVELKTELFSGDDRILVFVGRLTPQKKLGMLLDALQALRQENNNYKLLLIGDGSEREGLTRQAAELGIAPCVHFYGACYDDEVLAPLMMMADVCVSPGEVGLTAMHALVFGTPVVTHDNFSRQMPEFEAIIPQKSGAFYHYNDTADLCAKIRLVVELIDAGKITAEGCRETILKYYNIDYQYSVFKRMLEGLPR
jgi:glycosyltransferase involved in cell wall biosynthesis